MGTTDLRAQIKHQARPLAAALRKRAFRGSGRYWEDRYARGEDSGVGSYGQLAEFKADTLNRFVAERGITSLVEFGCGDGNQLELAEYPRYLGLDVATGAIDRCRQRFADDATKSFTLYSTLHFTDPAGFLRADMAMSLDVLFHLVEDEVFEAYLRHVFASAERCVVIYSSNFDEGDKVAHVRHRKFTQWVEANQPGWRLVEQVDNPHRELEGAVAEFYFYERA